MTLMEAVNLGLGVVSMVLAVVAIWQSMYFFQKGKPQKQTPPRR